MKVIILAGGLGTRLGEVTEKIPKPMVELDGKPILWHIMNLFSEYGHKDFYIATGYKSEVIEKYFADNPSDWNVNAIDTGLNTMTGGRAKLISKYIGNEPCFLTYGDGLSNINIDKLLNFHKKNKKIATISAVRPTARFGELYLEGNMVLSFKEKPQLQDGWINGGFFVLEPEFFNYIDGDEIFLEREPIEKIAEERQLVAYKHEGFWQCMDTRRDWELLKSLLEEGIPPWKIKDE
jgi:glucose-1-phosphate cytidylyltransferase